MKNLTLAIFMVLFSVVSSASVSQSSPQMSSPEFTQIILDERFTDIAEAIRDHASQRAMTVIFDEMVWMSASAPVLPTASISVYGKRKSQQQINEPLVLMGVIVAYFNIDLNHEFVLTGLNWNQRPPIGGAVTGSN